MGGAGHLVEVVLYTRAGCHLCEEAKQVLRAADVHFSEVDIDADPDLRVRYNEEVPVLFLGPRKVAKFKVDLGQLRRQLENAG